MNDTPILCPSCQTQIGSRIVDDKGKLYFSDGLSMILVGYRFCPTCGKKFYWDGTRESVRWQDRKEKMAGAW